MGMVLCCGLWLVLALHQASICTCYFGGAVTYSCVMSLNMRAANLFRQAFAVRRPLTVSLPSSCVRHHHAFPSGMANATISAPCTVPNSLFIAGGCTQQYQLCQRAGLSTLRRGLTGPFSARVRLPMRGLEEFRDFKIVKVFVQNQEKIKQSNFYYFNIKTMILIL